MAKKIATTDVTVAGGTSDNTVPAATTTEAFGFSFDVNTAPVAALQYIVAFGFRQSLSDATAGLAKAAHAAFAAQGNDYAEYCADAGLDPDSARGMSPGVFIAAVCDAARRERYNRIMSGTMNMRGPRSGSQADSTSAMRLRIAKDWLKTFAASKGKTLPKGKVFDTLLADYMSKISDKLEAEVARRMTLSNNATAEVDLDFG